ncbi:MAG: TSUP family transporter [Clostridiales bacterium]|nr:TSUP family transporter [Candidatus Crickella merdequi]
MNDISLMTFVIVCPLVFLAGFVDAIGGGGGLISLPAYIIAGLPTHLAIGTNKLSNCCGTAIATGRFIRNGMVNFRLGIPSIVAAIAGSYAGAALSVRGDEQIMQYVLLVILPLTAVLVLNKKLFPAEESERPLELTGRIYAVVCIAAFIIGIYDGFYGPGTGTFLIVAFTVFGKMSTRHANGQAKIINLTTNVTALVVFLLNGQVAVILGLAAAACNMLGAYIGSGLVMEKGAGIVRPSVILVLILLLVKIIMG